MSSRKVTGYSPMMKFLHWLIALAVIMMLIVGFFLEDIPEQYHAYTIHKSTGITLLFLVIFRFIIIHASGRPPLPDSVKLWEKALSRFVQYSFYILLILMPLSGWIMSVAAGYIPSYFGLFNLPLPGIGLDKPLGDFMSESHTIIAWILIVFVALHIAGALKHHFINKDNVLKQMLPGKDKTH
jgi:cytochrome b561